MDSELDGPVSEECDWVDFYIMCLGRNISVSGKLKVSIKLPAIWKHHVIRLLIATLNQNETNKQFPLFWTAFSDSYFAIVRARNQYKIYRISLNSTDNPTIEELATYDRSFTSIVYNNITGEVIWGDEDEIWRMRIDDATKTQVPVNGKYLLVVRKW